MSVQLSGHEQNVVQQVHGMHQLPGEALPRSKISELLNSEEKDLKAFQKGQRLEDQGKHILRKSEELKGHQTVEFWRVAVVCTPP